MQTWLGVKIPKLGYLDPHPLSLSVDGTISLGFVKQSCKVILPIHLEINQPYEGKKTFFKVKSGVGVKIPCPGYLDPHPISLSVDVTKVN